MASYRLALKDILSLPNERYAGNGTVVNEPTRQLITSTLMGDSNK